MSAAAATCTARKAREPRSRSAMASRRAESCRGRPAKWILLTFDKDGELARG